MKIHVKIFNAISSPGIVILCVAPCCSLTTEGMAVVGEELILPLSGLGVKSPLTRTSQLAVSPTCTSVSQSRPANLHV